MELNILGVAAAIALGVGLLLYATWNWGPGANSDGLTYLVLARHLQRYRAYGFLLPDGSWQPNAHFPPGYPLSIAFWMPLTRGNEATAALLVNLVSLALLISLTGWEVYRVTRHLWPTLALSLWLAAAFPLLRLYAWVLSEGPFLTWILITAWALRRWLHHLQWRHALLLGLILAWSVYLRWIGVALLPWVAMEMLLAYRQKGLPWRSWRLWLPLAVASLPVTGLFLASRMVSGALASRRLSWHPPTLEKWQQAVDTLNQWISPPFAEFPPDQTLARVMGLLLVSALVSLGAWVRLCPVSTSPPTLTEARTWIARWWRMALWYIVTLVGAITLMDASTPMDWRLLAPLYLSLTLALGIAAWYLLTPWWPTALLLALVWAQGMRLQKTYNEFYLRLWHRQGAILRSQVWQTADIWNLVAKLPEHLPLYTNEDIELRYYTNRPSWPLPNEPLQREDRLYECNVINLACTPLPYSDLESWWQATLQAMAASCSAVVLVTIDLEAKPAVQAQIHRWQERLQGAFILEDLTNTGAVYMSASCPAQE